MLPDKRANTYLELLRQLQLLTNNAVPADITIDVEASMIRAIWLFHVPENVLSTLFGPQQMYLQDEVFRENIRMIPSLSFVTVQDIVAAFDVSTL